MDYFTRPEKLAIGDLVVGYTGLRELALHIRQFPTRNGEFWRTKCKEEEIPLYIITRIAKRCSLWRVREHQVTLWSFRREEFLQVNLLEDKSRASKGERCSIRDWALLREVIEEVIAGR